jgi:hypothetical protein
MKEIDRHKVKTGFLFMWQMLDHNGLIREANDYAENYQKTDENPDNLTFICWALANRFFDAKQDSETVWEKTASIYLEQQITFEKTH